MPDLPYNGPTKEPDEFGLIARDLDVTATTTSQDEYKAFADDTPFPISGTALSWRLEPAQQKRYPILSQMAIDILSIPANQSESSQELGDQYLGTELGSPAGILSVRSA